MFILETIKIEDDELFGQRPLRAMWGPYPDFDAATDAMSEMAKEYSIVVIHLLHAPKV